MKYKYMYIVEKRKWAIHSCYDKQFNWQTEHMWLFRTRKEADEFIEKMKHTRHTYYVRDPKGEWGYTKVCFLYKYNTEVEIHYTLFKRRIEGTAE